MIGGAPYTFWWWLLKVYVSLRVSVSRRLDLLSVSACVSVYKWLSKRFCRTATVPSCASRSLE